MGNRAIIQTRDSYENEGIGVYLHWNGGYDSVSAFLRYCELKGYRTPDTDCYGWARLCQVIGNFFGGTTSLGIDNFGKNAGEWQDNGTYIIEGWKIVDRKFYEGEEQNEYDLVEMLIDIDKAQPADEQLGVAFITAQEVSPSDLKIGDKVWLQNFSGKWEIYTVVGFGPDEMHNDTNVKGVPYVDNYDHNGDYSWNINNYIRAETVRKV